jgi:transcriptional regulator with XRE-family HTH domain
MPAVPGLLTLSGQWHNEAPSGREGSCAVADDSSVQVDARRRLGGQLRQLREAAGLTLATAGLRIRRSESTLSRIEDGRVPVRQRDAAGLMTLYGLTDKASRAQLLELARQSAAPAWWQRGGLADAVRPDVRPYIGLEDTATVIRTYEPQVVPGLLQTRAYAEAVIRAGTARRDPRRAAKMLELRMRRQDLLDRPDPPRLWALTDEAALRRPPGRADTGVLRAQLEHLISMCGRPRITVQVLPLSKPCPVPGAGAFTILRFENNTPGADRGGPGLPDVVYTETLGRSSYLKRPADLDLYKRAADQLAAAAPPPGDTPAILRQILCQI